MKRLIYALLVTVFLTFLSVDTGFTEIKNNKAILDSAKSFMSSKNYDQAAKILTKGIQLDPQNRYLYLQRSFAYSHMNNYKKAIDDMNTFIELTPNDALGYKVRGMYYGGLGNINQEINDYDKAIELDPMDGSTYLSRSDAFKRLGKHDLADKDIKMASSSYINKGISYLESGKYDLSIDEFNEALKINPRTAVYSLRGAAEQRKGNYEKAKKDYEESLKYKPKHYLANYKMASLYAIKNNSTHSCAWLEKAISCGFNDWDNLNKDNDFSNIRASTCFKNILSSRIIKRLDEKSIEEKPDTQITSTPAIGISKTPPTPAKVQITPTQTFTSPTIKAKFVLIPAGTFVMGSPRDEAGREEGEDQREMSVDRPFYMQTTEVTQGQWEKIIHRNASRFKNCGDDCPVERVTRDDIEEFIKKLNTTESTDKYRLPTEAEWEYAARAGTVTPFYSGSCLSTDQANYDGQLPFSSCPKGKYRKTTTPVGSFSPNAWGLYDMLGNVYELVQEHVARGGSWEVPAQMCRSASRLAVRPEDRLEYIGFRLVRTAD